ncbi:MAG: ribulose-phosphate 3-epimerase, partial [Chloroflexi bacterium]|nr:ribulose-phosphate 3-epimerase [Chloroflexota bacterium]
MLKCSTSLWSADLANLASEMKRVEPYSERFHIDVADGHYVKTLLFFPDQVKALRPHTRLPLEVHLMVTDPLDWVEPFVEAGADSIIFCFDSTDDPARVLRR